MCVFCNNGFLLVLVLLFAACEQEPDQQPREIPFRADGVLLFEEPSGERITRIAIEIAEGDSAQARGLMQRRSLPERGGMFFPYPDAGQRSFWMENTYIPLDILFVGSDSTIINIAERTLPLSREAVESTGPAQYVVEVRGGFTDRHGIEPGDRIDWRRSDS